FAIDMSGFEQPGDGAVYTTIEDLLKWDQNFYAPKVGGASLLEQLQMTGVLNSGKKLTYARGLGVETFKGLKKVSHGGSWAGYRAELLRFPEKNFSVICLCNLGSTNPSALAQRVADVFLADAYAKEEPKAKSAAPATPVTLSEAGLKKRVGLYRNPAGGSLRRVTLQDNKLWMDALLGPRRELQPLAADRFRVLGVPSPVEVSFASQQNKTELRLTREDSPAETFVAVEAASPTPAQLAAFTGMFYSEELDATYRLSVENEKLAVQQKGRPPRPLTPTTRDAFLGPGGALLEFQRDPQGRVSGFLVHAGRIRNVAFSRTP
ncbi:MAG: hypothetical protein M1451_11565, partial [Acidobacteria bacterium]|nr:hypothetical protein [Acidobacteriota bacterium]